VNSENADWSGMWCFPPLVMRDTSLQIYWATCTEMEGLAVTPDLPYLKSLHV